MLLPAGYFIVHNKGPLKIMVFHTQDMLVGDTVTLLAEVINEGAIHLAYGTFG
jgi:hypothetical protein